jgi:hypothetical protein
VLWGQEPTEPSDFRGLIRFGEEALARNGLHAAAHAFQRAIDLNPSSARAHEGLGIALFRQLSSGGVRISADSDVAERAEEHLKQAVSLSPSASRPRIELSELESFLAERSPDSGERADHYRQAREALQQAAALEPGRSEIYLKLANLERDQFGPALDQVRARYAKTNGPIPDASLRKSLQDQYLELVNDAITNAQRASEMKVNLQAASLLSKLFRARALLRDTQDEYVTDMHTAADWERQFLSLGGHVTTERKQ